MLQYRHLRCSQLSMNFLGQHHLSRDGNHIWVLLLPCPWMIYWLDDNCWLFCLQCSRSILLLLLKDSGNEWYQYVQLRLFSLHRVTRHVDQVPICMQQRWYEFQYDVPEAAFFSQNQ
jgi:hypothetical protein